MVSYLFLILGDYGWRAVAFLYFLTSFLRGITVPNN